VDSAGDAVLELQVHLGDSVLGEDGGIRDITCVLLVLHCLSPPLCSVVWRNASVIVRRTDGSRLDHVADGESLDCLVLGCASRAVGATDRLDVAATLLVSAVGRSLLNHGC
jgi:hypothetical protein